MKNKVFLAINLDDFHSNQQRNCVWTEAKIRFISAENIEQAKKFVQEFYPSVAWVVIPKNYFDRNIVYKTA